ncbi:unnamed protein product [Lactuca virosa]|uniref:Uncharacterized protein n=1 Tax=Lactuca virosa TaxID=75947 RepID=A0AAU9NFD2_9ASTR|nr:unnamed protein product [Lactuca virosa]
MIFCYFRGGFGRPNDRKRSAPPRYSRSPPPRYIRSRSHIYEYSPPPKRKQHVRSISPREKKTQSRKVIFTISSETSVNALQWAA